MRDVPEDAITRLYAVPPGAFTRERDALVKTLAGSARQAEARALRRLRRPSASLWAANQLAHAEPERLRAFLEGITQVRSAQLRDPRAAAEALGQQRRALAQLVRRAGELLAAHGSRATPETGRRISDTLLGAAVEGEHAEALAHGRLTQELAAPGFEVLAGGGRPAHLHLVHGGKAARDKPDARQPARGKHHDDHRGGDTRRDSTRDDNTPASRAERPARRALDQQRRREQADRQASAAERAREEEAARERQAAAARQREMAERQAAVEQAEREARELNTRLVAARQRLAEARRAARAAARPSRRRPSS